MKIIIAGSRDITDYELVKAAIKESNFQISEVVSGGARGVDRLGERYAKENNKPISQFIPDWDRLGKSAGYKRNEQMAEYAKDGQLIAVTNGSRGTQHMIDIATKKGLKIYVCMV